ncbi:hypothetical protein N7540_006055 [Penicillium herquei]|nr:hypothetical protein N7540_006055 [Penicillium herquei]
MLELDNLKISTVMQVRPKQARNSTIVPSTGFTDQRIKHLSFNPGSYEIKELRRMRREYLEFGAISRKVSRFYTRPRDG